MKQSDLAVLILVVVISLFGAYLIGNAFINTDDNRTAEVEVVAPVASEFSIPSEKVFNEKSINPTENIRVGESNQQQPFSSGESN